MISAEYCQQLARYNNRQKISLYREAEKLTDQQRRQDRGAFFKSIHRTMCHVLTADHIWMARFNGWEMPLARGDKSPDWISEWLALLDARKSTDSRLVVWADGLTDKRLEGEINLNSDPNTPEHLVLLWPLVVHMFNHQTHQRGQVHAMLTGFGMKPDATDFGFTPINNS